MSNSPAAAREQIEGPANFAAPPGANGRALTRKGAWPIAFLLVMVLTGWRGAVADEGCFGTLGTIETSIAVCTAAIGRLESDSKANGLGGREGDLVRALQTRGSAYYAQERYDLALSDFDRAAGLSAERVPAALGASRFMRGMALLRMSQFARAIPEIEAARMNDPERAAPWFARGFVKQREGDFDGAATDIATARRIDRLIDSRMAAEWGIAVGTPGQLRESCTENLIVADTVIQAAACTVLIEFGHETPRDIAALHDSRAWARAQLGDLDRSIRDYDEAIRLGPTLASAFSGRANAYIRKGWLDRAIPDFDRAIELEPDESFLYHQRGEINVARGFLDLAIQDFDRSIKLDAEQADVFISRGKAYAAKAVYDRAFEDYDQALALGGSSVDPRIGRGVIYLKLKDYIQARAEFDGVLQDDPQNAVALFGQGIAARAQGDNDAADKALEHARQIDPEIDLHMAEDWAVRLPPATAPR